jgi:hypothetical protein
VTVGTTARDLNAERVCYRVNIKFGVITLRNYAYVTGGVVTPGVVTPGVVTPMLRYTDMCSKNGHNLG